MQPCNLQVDVLVKNMQRNIKPINSWLYFQIHLIQLQNKPCSIVFSCLFLFLSCALNVSSDAFAQSDRGILSSDLWFLCINFSWQSSCFLFLLIPIILDRQSISRQSVHVSFLLNYFSHVYCINILFFAYYYKFVIYNKQLYHRRKKVIKFFFLKCNPFWKHFRRQKLTPGSRLNVHW